MIQRIQTLWLSLAVLLSIAIFFFPLAMFKFDFKGMDLNYIYMMLPDNNSLFKSEPAWSLIITNCLVGVISLITIFLYNNRALQRKVLAFAFLFALIEIALAYFYQIDLGLKQVITSLNPLNTPITITDSTKTTFGVAFFFPIAQLIFFVFAMNGIKKDEAIIRNSERLR